MLALLMGAARARSGSKAVGGDGAPPRPPAEPSSADKADSIPPPPGLEAYTFDVGGDEYALLAFELPEIAVPAGLSPAEREVVLAVAAGQSNAEIAKARGTSANTVANQLRSIYGKLKISNRIELIRLCARGPGRDP
jgi:DNA-binding CsgD family transcriptional regulator